MGTLINVVVNMTVTLKKGDLSVVPWPMLNQKCIRRCSAAVVLKTTMRIRDVSVSINSRTWFCTTRTRVSCAVPTNNSRITSIA